MTSGLQLSLRALEPHCTTSSPETGPNESKRNRRLARASAFGSDGGNQRGKRGRRKAVRDPDHGGDRADHKRDQHRAKA